MPLSVVESMAIMLWLLRHHERAIIMAFRAHVYRDVVIAGAEPIIHRRAGDDMKSI